MISVSTAGYGVLFSGINTSESEVISNDYDGEFTGDTIWNATLRSSDTTAYVGGSGWQDLFGRWMNYSIFFRDNNMVNITNQGIPIETPNYQRNDSTVCQIAQVLVENQRPSILGVHFSETDSAGEDNGPFDQSYIDALQNQDQYIGEILSTYESVGILDETLVIITADHGMVSVGPNKGNHGGIEPEALHIPLLIRGPGVNEYEYDEFVHQNSITPTIAAVMGYEIPSDCSGNVLYDAIDFSNVQEAIYRIHIAEIRYNQAATRRERMFLDLTSNSDLPHAESLLTLAKSNFQDLAYSNSISNAIESEQYSSRVLRESWNTKITGEIISRSLLTAAGIALVIIVLMLMNRKYNLDTQMFFREKKFTGISVFSIIMYFIILLIAIPLTGWKFSASYVPEAAEDFMIPVLITTTITFIISGIIFGVLLAFIKVKSSHESETLSWILTYLLGVAIVYVLGLHVFVIRNGPGLPWYAPNLIESIQYFFVSISIMVFGLLSLIALLGGLGISRMITLAKNRISLRQNGVAIQEV